MKKKLLVAGALAVLVALVWLASVKLAPVYRHTMAGHLLRAAESARDAHHYDEAFRFYRLAIQRDPGNPAALRSYAGFLDEMQRPEVLAVRLRIIQLDPGDTAAKLDGIEAAIKLRKLNVARRLLENPSAEMQTFTRYFDLLGWLQVLSYDLPEADATWTNALEKNPGNRIYEANLAMVRLSSQDEAIRNKAFDDLAQLVLREKPPLSALDSLMVFAAQSPREPAHLDLLLERFQSLVPPTNPFFTSYLDALRRWRPERFKEALPAFTRTAASVPEVAMTAQSWMVSSRLYQEFLTFRQSLPTPLQQNLQSILLEAEALFNLKRMDALSNLLLSPVWSSDPALKMAWQERMRRVVQPPSDYDTAMQKWNAILAAAGRNDTALSLLARLAFNWGWQNEYTLTLWAVSERIPSAAPDALENLFRFYVRNRDSRNVRKVIKQQLAFDPDNPNLQNNLAFLSFLLGIETGEAAKMSADLCASHPKVPVYLSTRVFGFFKSGQPEKGLALFKEIDVSQLRGTAPGVCYGYLLAATGNPAALDYLRGAEKWASFPEEIELIDDARKKAAAASH